MCIRDRLTGLDKPACAEDVTGLKPHTEAEDVIYHVVAERSVGLRSVIVRLRGGIRSENADMSSDKECEKHSRRKPKGSCARLIRAG